MTLAGAETIRIETATHSDALDLARWLSGLHTYLVQLGDRGWHVCIQPDGEADELLRDVLASVREWAVERPASPVVRVGERAFDSR